MDRVTGGASDFVLGMAALDAPCVRGLIQMALQAIAIGLGRRQMPRVDNVGLVGGLGVFGAGPVTGFAGLTIPSTAFLGID